MKNPRVEIYKDKSKQWRGKVIARNGKILVETSESYKKKGGVVNALQLACWILANEEIDLI